MSASWKLGRIFSRKYSAHAHAHHSADSMKLWKNLSIFVALPTIGLGMLNCYLRHGEEDHHPKERVEYPYLGIINKKFPWKDGNTPLFVIKHE